jgi:hypothetical protein
MLTPVPVFLIALVLSLSVMGAQVGTTETVQAAEVAGQQRLEGASADAGALQDVPVPDDRVPVMIWTFMAALGVSLLLGVAYLLKQKMGGFPGQATAASEPAHGGDTHDPGHQAAAH